MLPSNNVTDIISSIRNAELFLKKNLASDLSSDVNKRLSLHLKKKKNEVKFTTCNFVCITESFDLFLSLCLLISSYKQFILSHSTKLFAVI